VYLLSAADEATPITLAREEFRLLGIDASGEDVFFETTDSLVPADVDSQVSWYDARVEGGFPAPSSPLGCSGEACQGTVPSEPVFSTPSSAAVTGGKNLPASPGKPPPKVLTNAEKLAKALRACRKQHGRRRRVACERAARRRYPVKVAAGSRRPS